MADTPLLGFAIRRENLCSSSMGEVDCGPTWGDFRACCPRGSYCPSTRDPGYWNAECCDQSGVNCTQTILNEGPFCANESWTMYDNYGYFCCDPSLEGFSYGITVGCANETTYTLGIGEEWISATVSQKAKPTETSSETDTPTSTSVSPGSGGSSGLSGGAIAGIVIGVVAAVVLAFLAGFFLMRRARKRKGSVGSPMKSTSTDETEAGGVTEEIKPAEPAVSPAVQDPKVAHDPSDYPSEKVQRQEPVELPANERPMEVPGSPVHPSSFQAEKPG